jgi:hypothetical protein
MSSSDDEAVGCEVEQEMESKPARKKRPWVKRIPIARRTQAIELKLLGKEDPEIHDIETGKKGSNIVRKRAHPLQPVQEQAFIPSNELPRPVVAQPTPSDGSSATPSARAQPVILPLKQDNQEIPILSYFSNQNIVNSSLSNELKDLREMCNKLAGKYGEEKQTVKKEKKPKDEKQKPKHKESEEPDVTDEELEAYMAYVREQERRQRPPEPQPIPQPQRPRRRVLDITKY